MTDSTPLRAARVRVPCSTSNLGSGYDTIGLALGVLADDALADVGAAGSTVTTNASASHAAGTTVTSDTASA